MIKEFNCKEVDKEHISLCYMDEYDNFIKHLNIHLNTTFFINDDIDFISKSVYRYIENNSIDLLDTEYFKISNKNFQNVINYIWHIQSDTKIIANNINADYLNAELSEMGIDKFLNIVINNNVKDDEIFFIKDYKNNYNCGHIFFYKIDDFGRFTIKSIGNTKNHIVKYNLNTKNNIENNGCLLTNKYKELLTLDKYELSLK